MDSEHSQYCDDPDCERSIPQWLPLRLRVLQTSILHKDLNLAVLDAYAETQFGRDVAPPGSDTPRIRLKEMPDQSYMRLCSGTRRGVNGQWSTWDPSTEHSSSFPGIPMLSRSVSPLPVCTTFLCHIHEDRTPCAECTSAGQGVIPLFAVPKEGDRAAEKRTPDVAGMAHAQEARDAKRALTSLRRTLLARLDPHHEHPSTSTQPPASYIDRSARRRAMRPSSQLDSPGVQSSRSNSPGPVKSSREPHATSSAVIEDEHTPGPLPEDNVGRQLLMKQGWRPGTSLGSAMDDRRDGGGSGLVEPIEVHPTPHRTGIGMPQKAAVAPMSLQEWKVNGRERWWESIRTNDEAERYL